MFLKNYNPWATYAHGFGWSDKVTDIVARDGSRCSGMYTPALGSVDRLDTIMARFPEESYLDRQDGSYSYGTYGVIFGTGNGAPTVDDYALSGERISGLNTNNITLVKNTGGDGDKRWLDYEYTIHNTTGAAITIGEIALVNYFSARKTSGGSLYVYHCLVERTALAAPITIEPDGVGQIHYKVQMSYPIT